MEMNLREKSTWNAIEFFCTGPLPKEILFSMRADEGPRYQEVQSVPAFGDQTRQEEEERGQNERKSKLPSVPDSALIWKWQP